MQHAFRTADQLGITPQEHEALIWVMRGLESGEIKDVHLHDEPKRFYMGYVWNNHSCGTAGCIAGWMGNHLGFEHPVDFANEHLISPLRPLFYPEIGSDALFCGDPRLGALAIRNFLVDGDPRWSQVMAGG